MRVVKMKFQRCCPPLAKIHLTAMYNRLARFVFL